jgi:uncharacterized membrane protein
LAGLRNLDVDILRGFAIVLMIIFHFAFDLSFLGIARINLVDGFWFLFPRMIGSMFLLLVGISLTISDYRDKKGKREGYWRHAKRGLLLAAIATAITFATWIYPHEGFIRFGIIHLIAVSTFIAPLFLRAGKLNVLFGLIVFASGFLVSAVQTDSRLLFWVGITYPGYAALDHYPLLPWFGVVLIGLYLGQEFFPKGESRIRVPGSETPIASALAFLGKNSLAIYLAHQIFLIGLLLGFRILFMGG